MTILINEQSTQDFECTFMTCLLIQLSEFALVLVDARGPLLRPQRKPGSEATTLTQLEERSLCDVEEVYVTLEE